MKNTPLNNLFLETIEHSFKMFLDVETSRSTKKLKPLHGTIAKNLAEKLGDDYTIYSQGYGSNVEATIEGRYINKKVDITIKKAGKPIAGIAVKFVMQNYSQNSVNYFENMLGETANIRTANYPYFQIFIILDKLPYYENKGKLTHWEKFTDHNMSKYCKLSLDNIDRFLHTPNKTLIYVVHIDPNIPTTTNTKKDYFEFYKNNFKNLRITNSAYKYKELANNGTIIMNDYKLFLDKVYHTIKAL